jgi:polar amino acid transport system permease protein
MNQLNFWEIITNLLTATKWTIILSLIAFVGGGIVGAIGTMMRISPLKPLKYISIAYLEFFQGTPLLMQLFLTFFGLSILFGVNLPALTSASIALTAFTSAYLIDIWRGSIEALPKGQWEASTSLGLDYFQQLRYIILPQALKLAIAPTIGFSIQVIKGTALASVIGFTELTKSATSINNITFKPFLVFSLAAAIYFCLCYPLSLWSKYLEKKLVT